MYALRLPNVPLINGHSHTWQVFCCFDKLICKADHDLSLLMCKITDWKGALTEKLELEMYYVAVEAIQAKGLEVKKRLLLHI